jgi:hypothetical protein
MTDAKKPWREKIKHAGSSLELLGAGLFLAILVLVIILGFKVHGLNSEVADAQKQLADANAATALAQTDLGQAKAASASLQSQLDNAKSQQSNLQSQVELSKSTSTQMQARLDRDKDASDQLQARLDSDKVHATELRAQLDQTTSGSTQLLSDLNQAKIQSMDLQARLQKAESDIAALQPLLMKTGHMPVTTSFEKVPGGRSFTLHVNNLYLQPVSVDITATGGEKTLSQHSIIGSGATQNVEKLVAGENVVITSEGYDPVRLVVQ